MTKSGEVILIENILQKVVTGSLTGDILVIAKRMKWLEDLYKIPCSSADFNIFVANVTDHRLGIWPLTELDCGEQHTNTIM